MKKCIALLTAVILCMQTLFVCQVAYAAVEPLEEKIKNGDMETEIGTLPDGWTLSSNASGATLSIVEDTKDSGNRVLRFDGTNNTGSNSYISHSVTLVQGYSYSFKIRLAETDTNTGNVYLYTLANSQGVNNKDRPKLKKGEWTTVSGTVNADGRKLTAKMISNQGTSGSNITKVIYEIDDFVVYNKIDAGVFEPVITGENVTLNWKSGVVEIDGETLANKNSEVSFTLSTPEGFNVKTVKVNNVEITDVKGVYTFTLPADLACSIDITTVEDLGIPHIVSVSPENCINMDPENAEVMVEFDREIDIATLNEQNVVVQPEASFTATNEGGFVYKLAFAELREGTKYTVTFTTGIATNKPANMEEECVHSFSTSHANNIIENSDMSSDTNLYYINSGNSPSYETIDGNRVLLLKANWENAPINQYFNGNNGSNRTEEYEFIPGHKYYAEAKIFAESDIEIAWRLYYKIASDSTTTHPKSPEFITVKANEWTTISHVFDKIPTDIISSSDNAVRLVVKTNPVNVYIDDWKFYDCNVAPTGVPGVELAFGTKTTDIEPGTFDVKFEFTKPMRAKSTNYEVTGADFKSVKFLDGNKVCVVTLDNIKINNDFNIVLKEMKSLAGEALPETKFEFEAKKINTATPVITVTPDGTTKTQANGLTMKIKSDIPLEGPFDKSYFITVPENLIEKVEWTAEKADEINLVFNQEVLDLGESYSVTILPTIKSLAGTSIIEKTIAFQTMTVAETVDLYKTIIDNDDTAGLAAFLNTNYKDLNNADTLFTEVIQTNDDLLSKFTTTLLTKSEGVATADEIADVVWETALLTIANEATDESSVNETVKSILNQPEKTGLAYTYTNYLSKAMKDELPVKIMQITVPFADTDKYISFVEENIILNAFKNSNGWETVSNIFNKNKIFFSAETQALIDNVNNSTYKEQMYGTLQGMDVSAAGDLYTKLNEAYNKDYSTPGGSIGGGSTGGSSGGGGGGYVPAAPEKKPTVSEESEKVDVAPKAEVFSDIVSVPWAKDAIEYLYELKVVNGKADGMFCPEDKVTREEFVKMLVIAANIPLTDKKVKYTDVSENDWFYPYVAAAADYGLVKGIDKNTYGTGQNITRQDIAVLCSRLLTKAEKPLKDEILYFADHNNISDYAVDAVEKVTYLGLMIGNDNLEFSPTEYATRAETAVILQRLIALLSNYRVN